MDSATKAAPIHPSLGFSLTAGIMLGFIVGAVAGVGDLLVATRFGQFARISPLLARPIAVLVPALALAGGLAGLVIHLLSRLSRVLYRVTLRTLPVLWVLGVLGYACYANIYQLNRITLVSAVAAVLVGIPTYLVLAGICIWFKRGYVLRVTVITLAFVLLLFVQLAAAPMFH